MRWEWPVILALAISVIAMACVLALSTNYKESGTTTAFVSTMCAPHPCHTGDLRIPRVIYRTARSMTDDAMAAAWDYTAKHNPDFTQQFFDDEDMAAFMRTALEGRVWGPFTRLLQGAAKADLFRYCLLYERGGVYLDSKSGANSLCTLIRPDDRMLVSTWSYNVWDFSTSLNRRPYGEFQQWWLAAEARHPALLAVIEKVIENIENPTPDPDPRSEVLRTTGPIPFTEVIDKRMRDGGDGVRLTCANGNGVMVYDVSGRHSSGASYSLGSLFRRKATRAPSSPSSPSRSPAPRPR